MEERRDESCGDEGSARCPLEGARMRKIFTVRAVWDADARVYYSESDISGLHIEAETLEEFESDLFDVAAELIVANHMTEDELTSPARDVMPAILYRGAPEKAL